MNNLQPGETNVSQIPLFPEATNYTNWGENVSVVRMVGGWTQLTFVLINWVYIAHECEWNIFKCI